MTEIEEITATFNNLPEKVKTRHQTRFDKLIKHLRNYERADKFDMISVERIKEILIGWR